MQPLITPDKEVPSIANVVHPRECLLTAPPVIYEAACIDFSYRVVEESACEG